MSKVSLTKAVIFSLALSATGSAVLSSCSSNDNYRYEEVDLPTQGLVTTVKEVGNEMFKIENEEPIPDTAGSLIVAKYLNSETDTFTLHEARLMQRNGYSGHHSGIFTAASYGFFGYMMGRNMRSYRPSSAAYVNRSTFDRVNTSTGNNIRNTATRVRRPSSGSRSGFGGSNKSNNSRPSSGSSSGYGGSRSSRSYGG